MREIYSITIYQRINNIEGLVKLNHTLTDELVSALLLATDSSCLLSSIQQAEINRIVQSSKAKMKNGAMSVKRLARYLNWHTYDIFLGYNGQLYKSDRVTGYIRDYNVMLDYCVLRDKIYDFSTHEKDEIIVEIKDKFSLPVDFESLINGFPDNFNGLVVVHYKVKNRGF